MKKVSRIASILICTLLLAVAATSCSTTGTGESSASVSSSADTRKASASILLSGSSASVSGTGAEAENGIVTITEGGTYEISGTLEDGQICVKAPDEDVTLILKSVSVTSSSGSPFVILEANSVTLSLPDGTESTLTDNETYDSDEDADACLYSKADLTIEGTGTLTVNANYKNGITGKDTLTIRDSTLSVTAANHGITGKDSLTAENASLTVQSGGDAIRSTNNEDGALGFILLTDCALDLTAAEDGVQAETVLTIDGGSYAIITAGGSDGTIDEDTSAKGLKAGTQVTISGGTFDLDCCDDAIHSNGNVDISGGSFILSTGGDGIHADDTVTVTNGAINILKSYEGMEGVTVNIEGGDINIVSSDDGINVADGTSSGFGGMGNMGGFGGGFPGGQNNSDGTLPTPPSDQDGANGGTPPTPPTGQNGSDSSRPTPPSGQDGAADTNTPPAPPTDASGEAPSDLPSMPEGGFDGQQPGNAAGSSPCSVNISGGTIRIDASGDGIDSNGDLNVSGGTIYVSGPTNDGDSALDYDGTAAITGGTIVAAGYSGMAQNFGSSSTQGSILLTASSVTGGTITLTDADGNVLVEYTPEKNYNCVVVSCPELTEGGAYTLSLGGETQTVTLTSLIYGSSGFGGMGGFGGDRMNPPTFNG